MDRHRDGILHIDEVAHLLSVLVVGSVAAKEADLTRLLDLLVGLGDQAAHLSLVPFVGTKDVEVFDAGDLIKPAIALRMEVEEVL